MPIAIPCPTLSSISRSFTPVSYTHLDVYKRQIKQGHEITRFTLPREEAIKFMKEKDEPYKVELIEELPEGCLLYTSRCV